MACICNPDTMKAKLGYTNKTQTPKEEERKTALSLFLFLCSSNLPHIENVFFLFFKIFY